MTPYLLILLCFLFPMFSGRRYRNIEFYILLIITAIFCGFRYEVGNDYHAYKDIYEWSINEDIRYILIEPFFRYLINIFQYLNINFEIYLFTFTLILIAISFSSFKYIFKNDNYILAIFLLFLNEMPLFFMSVVRQGMASAIVFVSSIYLLRNQYFYFIALSICAFLIHKISIIFSAILVIIYFFKLKSIYKLNFILLILCALFYIFDINFIIYLFDEKYLIYLGDGNVDTINFFWGGYFIFKLFIIFICAKYFYNINSFLNINLFLLIISVYFNVLIYQYGDLNLRLSAYFDFSLVYISAFILFNIKKYKLIYISFIFLYFTVHYIKFIYNFSDVFIPYRNYLFS